MKSVGGPHVARTPRVGQHWFTPIFMIYYGFAHKPYHAQSLMYKSVVGDFRGKINISSLIESAEKYEINMYFPIVIG